MVILENIDIDIDIDKAILQNIDIDKISNRFKFGISNRASLSRGLIATTRLQRGADLGPVTVRFGHRARCGLMRQKKNSWSSFSSFFSQLQMSLALLRLEGIVHFQVAFEETGPLPIVLFGGGCIQVFFLQRYMFNNQIG